MKTDFSPESLQRALSGQDAVVSMIPIVALAEQQKLVEAALAAGVKLFVPSEYGSDSTVCVTPSSKHVLRLTYALSERSCSGRCAVLPGQEGCP